MQLDFKLAEAFAGTSTGLDGVISALTWLPPPPPNPKTVVTYQGGMVEEYLIEGELEENSIPDKTNAIKVEIGTAVTSIGDYAFYGCSGLTSITIPNSVTSIGNNAFEGCSGLTSVTVPGGLTSIGEYAFASSGLTSITIPDGVTSIGDYAFGYCSGLTSITIPDGVTSIGNCAFYGCSGLTSITVDASNPVYDSRNNCNAIIKTSTNELIVGCKNTTIPNSVTSIGDFAFLNCSELVSITIPDGVTNIGNYAFRNCSSLSSITIPNSVTSIGRDVFYGCSGLTSITIPDSVTSIGNWLFFGCSGLTSITIPNSVTSIGDYAFYSCSKLTLITCLATIAPTVQQHTFGVNSSSYTGYPTRGNNVLKVPANATGYDSGAWADPLQNSTKCGFNLDTI